MLRREAFLAGLWGALGVAVTALGLYFGYELLQAATAVSTPFVAAIVVALLCDPVVDKFQNQVRFTRGRRGPAVALVYVLFLLSFAALVILVVPSLVVQIQNLIQWFAPDSSGKSGFESLRHSANQWLHEHPKLGPVTLPASIDGFIQQYTNQATEAATKTGPKLLGFVLGSFSGLLNIVLIPLLTFFLLMDLSRLRARLLFLLPPRARTLFVGVAGDIGGVFSNYLRGMMQVSLGYMVVATLLFFALTFFLAPDMLGYVLLIGIVSGALYVVPYVGFLGAAATAVTVALVTKASVPTIISSVVLLAVLNFTFDNVVTPRIVGRGVGVHPILGIFALLMGASLFGLWGMLLAYPAAGSIQLVLFRLVPKLAQPTPLLRADSSEV